MRSLSSAFRRVCGFFFSRSWRFSPSWRFAQLTAHPVWCRLPYAQLVDRDLCVEYGKYILYGNQTANFEAMRSGVHTMQLDGLASHPPTSTPMRVGKQGSLPGCT
jgi:hypothetical protein